jgi:hypothetical protein
MYQCPDSDSKSHICLIQASSEFSRESHKIRRDLLVIHYSRSLKIP